jgi:hypothetical protein
MISHDAQYAQFLAGCPNTSNPSLLGSISLAMTNPARAMNANVQTTVTHPTSRSFRLRPRLSIGNRLRAVPYERSSGWSS